MESAVETIAQTSQIGVSLPAHTNKKKVALLVFFLYSHKNRVIPKDTHTQMAVLSGSIFAGSKGLTATGHPSDGQFLVQASSSLHYMGCCQINRKGGPLTEHGIMCVFRLASKIPVYEAYPRPADGGSNMVDQKVLYMGLPLEKKTLRMIVPTKWEELP